MVVLALVHGQEGEQADPNDPCLAEDYAEANCAHARLGREPTHPSPPLPATRVSRWFASCADGKCCAQGGYKLPGHGYGVPCFALHSPSQQHLHTTLSLFVSLCACLREICKVVGPKVKSKKEL